MKIVILFFLCLCLAGCTSADDKTETASYTQIVTGEAENAETEEAGESESSGTAARSGETVVLTFDSFDGGGHEYTVEIADPSVIEYTSKRDYGSANYEEEDGSPFTMIFTFTGIKPGRTTVSIYGRSPIMENEDSFYEAVVDEELNVTLTPVSVSRE